MQLFLFCRFIVFLRYVSLAGWTGALMATGNEDVRPSAYSASMPCFRPP
jgi:hypothetical protein